MRHRPFVSVLAGVVVVVALSSNLGMGYAPNPGDCAVEGGGWVSANGGCQDPSGRVWAASKMAYDNTAVVYKGAKSYCASLAENGYSGWRLPSTAEFNTAVSYDAASHLYLPDQGWGRWLSETKGKMYGYFGVFQDGTVHQTLQTSELDVMCVR